MSTFVLYCFYALNRNFWMSFALFTRSISAPSPRSFPSKSSYPRRMYTISSTTVTPSAARPAITSAAPARRSGAETSAPVNFYTPSMIAVLPSTLMQAPMRASSSAYLKRFSKILSVTILVPFASASVTAICGCISVG